MARFAVASSAGTTSSSVPPSADERGWAVVEIRADGTLGVAQLVTAASPTAATDLARSLPQSRGAAVRSSALESTVGLTQAAHGRLGEAAWALARGIRNAPAGGALACAGQLALVEAAQGDLRRAQSHADQALAVHRAGSGARHASLALAWIGLERGDAEGCAGLLEHAPPPAEGRHEPWLATARLLVEARLLVLTQQADAALRLLARSLGTSGHPNTGWATAMLDVARADALLAAGEPHRALTLLTPLPAEVIAEASVVSAEACHAIGDLRAAAAVLTSVAPTLDGVPLALQVRAWLLQARLRQHRDDAERARLLVRRSLHACDAEDLRTPLLASWGWLRAFVEREPVLLHDYRDLLSRLRQSHAALPHRAELRAQQGRTPIGAELTDRETQVLELLARMYTNDEIAAALAVTNNTVKTHLKSLFVKLDVNRRVDAVRRAQGLGIC